MAEMKIIAVFWKRGCSRIMAASSKPSSSGMQTSTRITATSFLRRYSSASRPEVATTRFSSEFLEDNLIGEQLCRLIVYQKDIYLFLVDHLVLTFTLSSAAAPIFRNFGKSWTLVNSYSWRRFPFEIPGENSSLVVQELQMGDTSTSVSDVATF